MLGGEAAGCLGGGWALPPLLNCFLRLASVSLVYYMAHLHILHTPPHFPRIWNIDLHIRRSGGIQRCNESVACLRKKKKRVILSDGRFLSSSNLVNVFGNKKEAGESLLIG
jgi:hypothetical protein